MRLQHLPGKVRIKREGFLKARWEPDLVARFAKAAEAQGQTSAEALRMLALGFIRSRIEHPELAGK